MVISTSTNVYVPLQLINYYVKEKYTLRYTGGMVPDVNQVNNIIDRVNIHSFPHSYHRHGLVQKAHVSSHSL